MKEHSWVKHTLEKVKVFPLNPPDLGADSEIENYWRLFPTDSVDKAQITIGCDDCGLPLTLELYNEPCLSELEDQLEAEEPEEGP